MGMLCVSGELILASERSLVSTAVNKDPGWAREAATDDQITSEFKPVIAFLVGHVALSEGLSQHKSPPV